MYTNRSHTPAHLLLDNTLYFITGAIKFKRNLLQQDELKYALIDDFHTYFAKYNWELHHRVVLDNHYHLLGKSYRGKNLPQIIRSVHSRMAKKIAQTTNCQKPVWWNYWDYCPRDEADYYVRLNYLLNNPVKHGYVTNLNDYPFSSFHQTLNREGRETLAKQFQTYPKYKMLVLREAYDDDF